MRKNEKALSKLMWKMIERDSDGTSILHHRFKRKGKIVLPLAVRFTTSVPTNVPLGVCLTVSGGCEHASNPLSQRKSRTVNSERDKTEN